MNNTKFIWCRIRPPSRVLCFLVASARNVLVTNLVMTNSGNLRNLAKSYTHSVYIDLSNIWDHEQHRGDEWWLSNDTLVEYKTFNILYYRWWFDPISWQRLRLAQPNQSHHWWIKHETVARTISETSFLKDDALLFTRKGPSQRPIFC